MAIAINGSGTVTGISVGGLPDGIVDTDMLAANAVSSAKLASGAGGKILQVVSAIKTGEASTTSDTMADTGLSASITPSATSSKILVQVCHPARIQRSGEYEGYGGVDLLRDSTVIYEAAKRSGAGYSGFMVSMTGSNSAAQMRSNYNLTVMDSPSSTSSLTYKTQYAIDYSSQLYINPLHGDAAYTPHSTIVLMEVAG